MTIFISHSSRDAHLATQLVNLLRLAFSLRVDEIRCTSVDGYRLKAGADTDDQLRREVRESQLFLALITPSSVTSPDRSATSLEPPPRVPGLARLSPGREICTPLTIPGFSRAKRGPKGTSNTQLQGPGLPMRPMRPASRATRCWRSFASCRGPEICVYRAQFRRMDLTPPISLSRWAPSSPPRVQRLRSFLLTPVRPPIGRRF